MADENHPCALSHCRHHPRHHFVAPIGNGSDPPVGGSGALTLATRWRRRRRIPRSVVNTSSPGSDQADCTTAFTPVVAWARRPDRPPAPKNAQPPARAPRNRPAERPRNCTGPGSISSCQRCASNTSRQAPKLPWFQGNSVRVGRKVRACGALDESRRVWHADRRISVSAQS